MLGEGTTAGRGTGWELLISSGRGIPFRVGKVKNQVYVAELAWKASGWQRGDLRASRSVLRAISRKKERASKTKKKQKKTKKKIKKRKEKKKTRGDGGGGEGGGSGT